MNDNTSAYLNNSLPDGDKIEQLEYQQHMYKLVIPIFLLMAFLGILANTLIIVALKPVKIRNSILTLIMSLTLSDIWFTLILKRISLAVYRTSSVLAFSLLYNSYLPIVKGTDVNACFSLTLEILRTGGLFTGTVYPHIDYVKLRGAVCAVCFGIWLIPPGILLLLALAIPSQGFWNCERVDFYHSRFFRIAVSTLLLSMFVVITTCYTHMILIFRFNREKLVQNGVTNADKNRSKEKRILFTTVLICSSFFIGWAPATIAFALTCDTCELLRRQQFRTLFILSCVQLSFIMGKSLINPLIYSIRIPEVDAQIRRFSKNLPLPKFSKTERTEHDGILSMAIMSREAERNNEVSKNRRFSTEYTPLAAWGEKDEKV